MNLKYRHTPGVYPAELRAAVGRLIMTWAEIEHQLMSMLQMALIASGADPSKPLNVQGAKNRINRLLELERCLHASEPLFHKAFSDFVTEALALKDKREATAHGISCQIETCDGEAPGFVRHELFGPQGTRPEIFSVTDVNAAADAGYHLLQEAHEWQSEFTYLQMKSAGGARYYDYRIGWFGPEDVRRTTIPRRVALGQSG